MATRKIPTKTVRKRPSTKSIKKGLSGKEWSGFDLHIHGAYSAGQNCIRMLFNKNEYWQRMDEDRVKEINTAYETDFGLRVSRAFRAGLVAMAFGVNLKGVDDV